MLNPKELEFSCHHGHSHKSFGDSIFSTDRFVQGAKEMGYKSVTLTDHGSLVAMPEMVKEAEKQGIKWVVGTESYFVSDEVKDSQKQSRHLVVLVQNETGWKNLLELFYLSSIPVKDGGTFYVKPRFTDKEIFRRSNGLIFSSACLNGVISDYILKGDETSARLEAMKWKENVENFYIEVMPHRFDDQIKVNAKLVEIARDLDIPLLCTLDVHYEKPEQHEAWMINGAIRRRQNEKTFENHMSPDMYYKTIEQIIGDLKLSGLTEKEIKEAIDNSVKITNMIDFKWQNRMNQQPVFSLDIKAPEYLKQIAWQGLCNRFGGYKQVPKEYIERLKYEWEVISQMGYADYFLILYDFIAHAKKNGIICGPGRGSGCGSLMLWALHVTEVDSIKYKLPFERFLNISRVGTAPDYDADMEPEGRKFVIDYLKNKYGIEHVFQVANHSELKAKSAIKDVARFYNYSFDEANAITDKIPTKAENDEGEQITPTIKEVMEIDEIKPFVSSDPKLFSVAKELEGSFRGAGRHAGAVIITSKPVTEIIPVMRAPGDDDSFNLQTQWDKKQLESIGIHKYDILGLTTLTTLRKLEELTGIKCLKIPMDDQKTWEYLRKAKNMQGIFQLSSAGMRNWCRKIIPEYNKGTGGLVDYLSDINAINRPAVLDAGFGDRYVENYNNGSFEVPHNISYIKDILKQTNGVTLYQEQTMELVHKIAGFTLGEGDLLRRNLENMGTAGKRTEKVIKENADYKAKFFKGAKELHGYSDNIISDLWKWLSDSSGYSFNRAHSWSYSLLGYWTAYFKANYPLEFYCVSINEALDKSNVKDNPIEQIVKEAQNVGIKIELPNNISTAQTCKIKNGKIVYGLNMIKGLSEKVAELICTQYFPDFDTFCNFVIKQPKLNKKHVQILIKLGYFDEFDTPQHLWYQYQKAVWEHENKKKLDDWEARKTAGRKVREFNDLKFEAEELDGSKKEWLLELIGYQWENRLTEVIKELPEYLLNEDMYIIGEVIFTKTGVSKFKKQWQLVTLKTLDGEKKGFLQDPTIRIRKGEIITAEHTLKDETYTFYNISRY